MLLATGFVDAYTFLRHGHVFAEAMTGNLVLVAVGAVRPEIVAFWRPLAAYAAFVAGVLATEAATSSTAGRRRPSGTRLATLVLQVVVFGVVGALPRAAPQWAIVVAIAFASGMQIAAFRRIGGSRVTATVMTTNSARAIETIVAAARSRRREDVVLARTLVSSVSLFVAGAFAGAGASAAIGDRAAWIVAGLFALAAALSAQ